MEMYIHIDEIDQKEIEMLLEFKYELKEHQKAMLLSKLLRDNGEHKENN